MQIFQAGGSLTKGQLFDDGNAASAYIQAFALHGRKNVKSVRAGGGRKKYVCVSDAAGCPFSVVVMKTKATGKSHWFVSSVHLEHRNCTATPTPTQAQLAANEVVIHAVAADPTVKAKAIRHQLHATVALGSVSIWKVYRARAEVRLSIRGDIALGHQKLPGFLQTFATLNPGSIAAHEHDTKTGKFTRACLIHGALARAANFGQAILGIDGGHLKSDSYDGILILIVARDGNCKNLTVGAALVPSESEDNFNWFFGKLRDAGLDLGRPIFCDRAAGLRASAEALDLVLFNCAIHIFRNALAQRNGFNHSHKSLFYELQCAETVERFESTLALIEISAGSAAANYLRAIDPKTWTLHPHLHSLALYGWRSSNFVESEMSATKSTGLRSLHPYAFFSALVEEMMEDTLNRRARAKKWTAVNQFVTDGARALFASQEAIMGQYACTSSDKTLVFVHNATTTVRYRRRVCLQAKTCTCGFAFQFKVPCRHICAALHFAGQFDKIWDYFGPEYSVKTYEASFASVQIDVPLDDEIALDTSVIPSFKVVAKKKSGPRKSKRIPSRGESIAK